MAILRLKSLELQGFKTFASRTPFEFAGSVTAIVGPNGSGKSNIADSLRWVLGEQAYALLRAKKTEDMIFAGSEGRARAGMAQATITFDNSDGWLPIDFSEVAITRRAYRDGQNEYLINKQRVRLKDVTELLSQSGLAERTYTIIGQGLVDAALALKAEERRRLFEEAAGTGLHRARREEALRRLETTRRNLDRVQDILAELQPRLRSLERQARRAQEHEQVAADLRELLREWYGYHWRRAQQELAETQTNARKQESVLDHARRNQAQMEEKLTGVRDRLQSLRASLNSWHRQSALLHSRREAISRELAVADERVRALIELQRAGQAELARLNEELGLQQERAEASAREVERLENELYEARSQVESASKALAGLQERRARLEKQAAAARQSLAGLNNRQSHLQARQGERQAQAERAKAALQAAREASAGAEKELEAAQAWVQDTLEAQEDAQVSRRRAESAYAVQQAKLAEVDAARKRLEGERASAAAGLARLTAQLDVLVQAEISLSGYASGTRKLLEAAHKSGFKGARGTLISQLIAPAEIETAIAAALNEYLDAVILEEDAFPALDLLEKEAARGVLIPLQALKPSAPLNAVTILGEAGSEEILGTASDLVQAPADLRPAVDLLLGQVLIVRDRDVARQTLGKLPVYTRVVTLSGEVFHTEGPVFTSGAQEKAGGQSLLTRQRQRRELEQELAAAKQGLTGLDQRLEEIHTALLEHQKETDHLAQAQGQARQAYDQASLKVNQARLAEEQADRQKRWQQEQHDRLLGEIQRGEREAAQLARDLQSLEAEIGQVREQVRTYTTELGGLATDELQAQVAHWNTQSAVAERAVADGKARQRERLAAVEQARKARGALETRLEEIRQSLKGLEEGKAGQRQAESQVGVEIESLRVLIEPAETELEELEQKQAAQQTAEAAARQALTLAEHHHAQAKISLARCQESLESLRRRIEDDFGLVQFEYSDQVSGPTPLPLEGIVVQLPRVTQPPGPEMEEAIKRQRAQLRRMGAINPEAQTEYLEVKQRFMFLTEQVSDLEKAEQDIHTVISELDEMMEREFRKTFDAVNVEFKEIFTRLFGGGAGRLVLVDPEDVNHSGIDIEARLPGRRTQGLSLLSGGERSLTAAALVFSLLKVSPTPFCVLDEVDAMLDEANVGRFRDLLRELSQRTQFVIVTHNRNTVQAADVIYGITMGRDSASQVISLKLDEVARIVE